MLDERAATCSCREREMPPPTDDRTLLSGLSEPAKDDSEGPIDSKAVTTTGETARDRAAATKSEARELARSSVSRHEGSRFGQTDRFVEKELIGIGGMSTVVRAFDEDLRRDVAIKVLAPELSTNEAEVERFATEARITG